MMGPSAPTPGFRSRVLVKPIWSDSMLGTIVEVKVDIHLNSLERNERILVMWDTGEIRWVPIKTVDLVSLSSL